MKKMLLIAIITLFSVTLMFAHGNEKHLRGTVTKATDAAITIKTTAGKTVEVAVTPSTKFMKGAKSITAADIKENDRVVIHAKSNGDKLEAAMVMVGSMKMNRHAGDMKGMDMHSDPKGAQSNPK
ncbi:MAG: hypothetical protein NVS9B15_23480 [Acidobacteriaceae bacterium]